MSFANWNLLDDALTLIPPTKVQYRKYDDFSISEVGQALPAYGEWKDAFGIVQPNGEVNEHTEGIDFSKTKVVVWLRGVNLTGTSSLSKRMPDQIKFMGDIYNVVTVDNWLPYDNYRRCECVICGNMEADENDVISGVDESSEYGEDANSGNETSQPIFPEVQDKIDISF